MRKTKATILAAVFAALTAVGAFIRIPMPISSFTLQVLFTSMAGVLLGWKWGAASQAVYVLLGLVGLPVFTFGGGFSSVLQPTFGFLLGMIPMAAVIGLWVEKRGAGFVSICAGCLLGLAVLYIIGLPYMHLVLTVYLQKEWTVWQTVKNGMLLFLPWDFLKIAVTGLLCMKIYPALRRETGSL